MARPITERTTMMLEVSFMLPPAFKEAWDEQGRRTSRVPRVYYVVR